MVDSRGYEILSAEEVEELRKEHTVLSSRVGALQRKLATEVKIRDAAQTLARLNTSNSSPSQIARQSSSALEAAERKVAATQTELWRLQERAANIDRRLLEHRAGVLGAALAEAERSQAKEHNNSMLDTDSGFRSPLSSASSLAVTTPKFDGAHFFAGHEDAIFPRKQSRGVDLVQDSGSGGGASQQELEDLEVKLVAAEALAQQREAQLEEARIAAASELENARADAAKELADARTEGASEVALVLKRAGELEGRVADLQRKLESSMRGKDDAAFLEERIRTLERELEDTRSRADQARRKTESAWNVEKSAWASERALLEQERGKWAATATAAAGLEEKLEKERAMWEQEREELVEQAKDQIADAADGLRALVQRFDIPLFSRGSGISVFVDALGRYLEKHNAQVHEQLLVVEVDKRSAMAQELEAAKDEIQALQAYSSSGGNTSSLYMEPKLSSPITFAKDAAGFVAILQPLWATLPSPEARAARLSNAARPFRAGNGRSSPNLRLGAPGSPAQTTVSISDMDVRALKSLYTPAGGYAPSRSSVNGGRSSSPSSPTKDSMGPGIFSVEAFAQRVQALISDDRALMERLIRFAQAHDLLKKNAERAQKLAQESNSALETYQKQVRTLEEHLARSDGSKEQIEKLTAEKLATEERAAEQAETLRQLTEANATLSARALQLAQDATAAQDELRAVSSMSERDQAQKLALLEEINLVQTENGNLRQQLRALGKL